MPTESRSTSQGFPAEKFSIFIWAFCHGLNADHKVTQAEVKAFIVLLRNIPSLLNADILREHREKLERLTEVPQLWPEHCRQAEAIIFQIIGVDKEEQYAPGEGIPPLEYDKPDPKDVRFSGANVVFSGDFHIGRNHAEEIGIRMGAQIQGAPSRETGYVIVGSIPSSAWRYGSFGTKIARALVLKREGCAIQIITEEIFTAAIPTSLQNEVAEEAPPFRIEGFSVTRIRPGDRDSIVPAKKGPLAGISFVLTGTLQSTKREDAEAAIIRAGGIVGGKVTRKTNYLVAGLECGSKLDKARLLDVPVISEADLAKMLGGQIK